MAKFTIAKCAECEAFIAEHGLVEYGGAKLTTQYCPQMGIDEKTHRNWLKLHPKYREAVERGKETFKSNHTQKLFGTLMEAAVGGERTVTDEHTEFRPDPRNPANAIIRKQTRSTKTIYCQPNVVAAIFLLCNLDPEHFKNRQQNDIAIKRPEAQTEMTIDEINAEIDRLKMLEEKDKEKTETNEE